MKSKNHKQFSSLILQLNAICQGDPLAEGNVETVRKEFERASKVANFISNQDQVSLNKVLHATRGFDTGLKTILEHFGTPLTSRSLRGYLNILKNGKTGCYPKLNGNFITRIQTDVVDKRNIFMHAAGQFPSKREAEQISGDIATYFQNILSLIANSH
ncbi:MAG: hypothetical protein J1D77_01315 [Muribaculaceae bacterium]|nr:hypothetical protein [Muribaculaceae bacterium]